jgi:rare lipoprotein A (peptidoglycan hydrolase)
MRRYFAYGVVLALFVADFGAAQKSRSLEANPAGNATQTPRGVPQKVGKTLPYQVGTASWYGEDFDGKPTASGEPYDMHDMTAASLTIPLGTYVKVTNLHNGRAVVVKVNDRGPVVAGRIIDLSYGAAQALEFQERGLQRVRLDLVHQRQNNQKKASTYQTVALNHPVGLSY